MTQNPPRLLIFGAHPDDAEFRAGGLATEYRQRGSVVKMISMTDGGAGHHEQSREELVARRREEAAASGRIIGAESAVWSHPDGHLQATLDLRWEVIREIRTFAPDLLLCHRPEDYHPDHRAVGQVVRDACYLVTVPKIVPDTPILKRDPVVAYLGDPFTRPTPLRGDVVLDVTGKLETILQMLLCHESQFFEWLPFNLGNSDQLPADESGRHRWARSLFADQSRSFTERYREQLVQTYGPEQGRAVEFAEVFEVSEYAAPLDNDARRRLFPMLP